MDSVKELLHDAIELLSDEEARQVLALVQLLQKRSAVPLTLRRLAADPAFKVPSGGFIVFSRVDPAEGRGTPASTLLVDDRR